MLCNFLRSHCPLCWLQLANLIWLNSLIRDSIKKMKKVILYHQHLLAWLLLVNIFVSAKQSGEIFLSWFLRCPNEKKIPTVIILRNMFWFYTETLERGTQSCGELSEKAGNFKTALTIKHELMHQREELLIMENVGNLFALNKRTLSDMTAW